MTGRWALVGRWWAPLAVFSLLVAAIAGSVAGRVTPTHEVHFSYVVSLRVRQPSADYQFDGYYALQATELFASTVARWVSTPELVVAAYEDSGLQLPTDDPDQLTSAVRATKTAPQLVEVVVRGRSRDGALALSRGVQEAVERHVSLYHDEGIPALHFAVVATNPWVGVDRLNVPLIVIATIAAVLFLGLNALVVISGQSRAGRPSA